MNGQDELLPSVYEIQQSWTGLSWETCGRLQNYIEGILSKAKPIIEKQLRAELNAEIRIELGSKAFEKGKKQEREGIFLIMNHRIKDLSTTKGKNKLDDMAIRNVISGWQTLG